jgi:hypothetical protein
MESSEFDLRLIPSLGDADDIPMTGRSQFIIANVRGVLHFRIFENDGRTVVDTDESRLTVHATEIRIFKDLLERLYPPHELMPNDIEYILTTVIKLTAQNNLEDLSYELASMFNITAAAHAALDNLEDAATSYRILLPELYDQYHYILRMHAYFYNTLNIISQQLARGQIAIFQKLLDFRIAWEFDLRPDSEDFSMKKVVVKNINDQLRSGRFSIAIDNRPVLLLAVGSPDRCGRYVLKDRETKKRSKSRKSIKDLLPLQIVPAPL